MPLLPVVCLQQQLLLLLGSFRRCRRHDVNVCFVVTDVAVSVEINFKKPCSTSAHFCHYRNSYGYYQISTRRNKPVSRKASLRCRYYAYYVYSFFCSFCRCGQPLTQFVCPPLLASEANVSLQQLRLPPLVAALNFAANIEDLTYIYISLLSLLLLLLSNNYYYYYYLSY